MCMGPFERGAISFITSTIVWPQVNSRERTQLHPSTENWIKDLLSMAPPIRKRSLTEKSENEMESEKVGLKLNIQKTKITASGPITSWETVKTVAIFLGSKITAGSDCICEIKRHLLLGRKVMTNLDNILKNRDTTLSTKVCLLKAMVLPIVMYGCESWTIKKAEH